MSANSDGTAFDPLLRKVRCPDGADCMHPWHGATRKPEADTVAVGRVTHTECSQPLPENLETKEKVMAVKARFYIAEITRRAYGSGWAEPAPVGDVVLRASTRGEENKSWASATPSGEFKMTVNGPAFPWFAEHLGQDVSILIEEIPE